jgi:hypothetical protein
MPERPKGAVCKTAGYAYGGSNPPPPMLAVFPLANRIADALTRRYDDSVRTGEGAWRMMRALFATAA